MSTATTRAADRAHIADIAAQILTLKPSLRVLRAEQQRTQERLDSYTYPVLTLPNEIVLEIFIHFVPGYPLSTTDGASIAHSPHTYLPSMERNSAGHARTLADNNDLDTLIAPALRTLELPDGFLRPDPIHTLTSFISKCGCRLDNVHITRGRSITKHQYCEAFRSIPKLTFDSLSP
ncbi:hypothetical protein FB451DRAFT_1473188 [Mycena latifolia]|nr:hypothetical protein FB451DRAFT_1473188 [Mycena latifolia]